MHYLQIAEEIAKETQYPYLITILDLFQRVLATLNTPNEVPQRHA